MIKQMFTLIWNRKRKNLLMITGLFISFFVVFIVSVTATYNLNNYFKPLGFKYEKVWTIRFDWKQMGKQEVKEKLRQVEFVLKSFPEIESFSLSRSILFMPGTSSSADYKYGNHSSEIENLSGGDKFTEVLGVEMLEGRWFDQSDNAAGRDPVVINKYTREEFFPNEEALGKIISYDEEDDNQEFEVIGVIGEFRFAGEFTGSKNVLFKRLSLEGDRYSEFVGRQFLSRMILKVKPGTGIEFEERLLKQVNNAAKGMTIIIDRMSELRKFANKSSLVLPGILAVICGFLITNVALGLVGMIWYSTNQRRSEIGLRRAAGATEKHIVIQILGETLVLSTFGIIIGSFFALQFPLLGLISFIQLEIYTFSFVFAVLFIYLISALCALYPSKIASKIQPAMALHYE